jgi:predicted DNA-binding transcriptional regulator YafY
MDILEDWKRKNELALSNRSLYRYLKELTSALKTGNERIEIYNGENNKKTWKIEFDDGRNDFTIFDINTFFLIRHFVPKSIIEHRKKSVDKIEKAIYAQQSKVKYEYSADANQLAFSNTNFYDIDYTSEQQQSLEDLIWAIQNKRKIIIKDVQNDSILFAHGLKLGDAILPLALKEHRGVLQICCYDSNVKDIFIISFDSLIDFEISTESLNAKKYMPLLELFFDKHFGITKNINDKIYDIELEFAEGTGKFVRQFFWHSSQKWKQLKNGNYKLYLRCGINRELAGWIFQWMNNVKVCKPLLLKKIVLQKYESCIGLYNPSSVFKQNAFYTKPKK